MRSFLLITIIFLMSFLSAFSQNKTDINIFGHVTDSFTGEHVPYINIQLKGTTIGTATDATGHFYLKNLPKGEFSIVASGLGYKNSEQTVKLELGKSIEINFVIEEDKVLLETVVVSANRNEVNRKEAPNIVNVISPVSLENTSSNNLAQALVFQPGLRVENNCQNCGFQQVRINGLDGPYSQILVDSRPIFSSLAGVYGLEQIPANMIDRVEIVRGGGSAIFGSNAIAGTINIITKEAINNSVTVANTANLIGGRSLDNFTSLNASLVSDSYKTGIVIFGSNRQQSPYDHDVDGFTEISKNNAKSIGFRAYHRTNYGKLSLEYHNINEFRRGGNNLHLPAHEADITEQLNHNINTGSIKYDLLSKDGKHNLNIFSSTQKIDRESYYGAQKDPNAYGTTDDFTIVSGLQYGYSIKKFLFMPAQLTLGGEHVYNNLKDRMLGYNRKIDQKINIESLFVQNEWKNEKLSILLGSRLDRHNLIKNKPIFSPRVNLRYSPSGLISVRASYSAGFRAPQTYDEDLHVAAVGGEVFLISVDPNLKTEKSQTYTASFDLYRAFGKLETNVLIEGFYTNLDNVFVLEEIGNDAQGNLLLERRNGAGAVVKGINLEGKLAPSNKFQAQLGFTVQKSEYVEPLVWSTNENLSPQKRMFRSPSTYGYLTAFYKPIKELNVSLSGTYTGSMLVQHLEGYISEDMEFETPEFFDLNIKIAYDFKINLSGSLQLNAGVKNIFNAYQKDFDQGEFRDAGYIYGPGLPRTYFAGLKIMI